MTASRNSAPGLVFDEPSSMPACAPLAMPTQDLSRPFAGDTAGPLRNDVASRPSVLFFRLATFVPAFVTVAALMLIMVDWFSTDGVNFVEGSLMSLVGFSSFWIAFSVSSAILGFFSRSKPQIARVDAFNAQNTALLVPVYNEDPQAVFMRVKAMRNALAARPSNHRFAIFVLSDTRDLSIAHEERAQFETLRNLGSSRVPLFYRRREENTERKTGNIRNWVENWGGAWDSFIVLDADSLMSARSIQHLANAMAKNCDAGLIQTVPRLLGAGSFFSRIQQFSNNVYGSVLARGLERWSATEGNYWGHNAIIRTRAFAGCAGLPVLRGKGPLGGTIKSHDFVEAALMRRAGWAIELQPDVEESYEEIPQTLIDYVLRDRRWCQGNLQHLKLLSTPGLAWTSRFHMLQGAMAYVSSVIWFALLIVWTLMGRNEQDNVLRYFTDANPLFPQWPHVDAVSRSVILFMVVALLLTPKILGLLSEIRRDPLLSSYAGPAIFGASAVSEIFLSFLMAPILMVQHVMAVGRTLLGFDAGWAPQNRSGEAYDLKTLMRFHWLETTIGILLCVGLALGIVSLWLVPVAISLAAAVPISHLVSVGISRSSFASFLMTTREDWRPARIITLASSYGLPVGLKPARARRARAANRASRTA